MKIKLRSFFWKLSEYMNSAEQSPINIVASSDGHLYVVRENDFMRMVVKQTQISELELLHEGVILKCPKIPGSYLATALAFFHYYGEKKLESAVHIYWDRRLQEYELICPEQVVSFDEVRTYTEPIYNADKEFVVSIHSHHEMPAFYSPGDNSNDRGFKVYGVVGRIHETFVDCKFRARFNDSEFRVDVKDLFDLDGVNSTPEFPEEWKSKVQVGKTL